MTIEELRELCALTVELTKLRQNECKHLCIENFAPDLLGKLIREHAAATTKATRNWAKADEAHARKMLEGLRMYCGGRLRRPDGQ